MKVLVDGHRQRMRDRVERVGPEDMRPQDLLEYLLYYSVPRRDTKQLAFDLIQRFGSLRAILRADERELAAVTGMGGRSVRWMKLLKELLEAFEDLRGIDRPRIDNTGRTEAYFRALFKDRKHPEVWQCSTNASGILLSTMLISDGSYWADGDYLREALEDAMTIPANSVVIGQFSPVAGADFEKYDLENTKRYAVTLAAAGIQLLDHMLIYPGGSRSMRALKYFDELANLTKPNALMENYLGEGLWVD